MAPDPRSLHDTVTRSRTRREPVPLEQIPVWDGFVADPPDVRSGDPPAGLDALLGGLNPDQLKAVTHGDGPLLVVARGRHREDPGHHPADRLADRDPAGPSPRSA
jgi:hypothetical protein